MPRAVEADPKLGALQLNAPGITPTMAIHSLSPAYSAGDDGTCEPFDQRDVPRPQSQHCDIGAYEFVKPSADLTIAKTPLATAVAGQDVAYAINVENNGPTAAQNVTITDVLPAGTTFVAVVGSGGFACSGSGPVICAKASMIAGEIALLTLTVRIPASVAHGMTITNTVTVGSTTPDPVPANNAASVTTMVVALADLSVTKVGPALPTAGADLSYAINVVNDGPSNAQNVSVRDTVPVGTAIQSITFPAGWTCITPTVGTPGPAAIQCDRSALSSGTTSAFTLVVRLDASTPSGSELCKTAGVSSTTFDPGNGANAAQSCGIVRTLSDLALTQTAATNGSPGKGTASFSLTLRNNGPSDSLNVLLVVTSSCSAGPRLRC